MDKALSELAVRAAVWASTQTIVDELWFAGDGNRASLATAASLQVVAIVGGDSGQVRQRFANTEKAVAEWQADLSKLAGRTVMLTVLGAARGGAPVTRSAVLNGVCVFSRAALAGAALPANISEGAVALRDVIRSADDVEARAS